MAWMKCPECSLVHNTDDGHQCAGKPKRSRTPSAESVRRHREKTGNAYGKAYAKARAAAVSKLIEMHPIDFAMLLEKERIDAGLGPTRR